MKTIGILSDTHSCWDDRYAEHFAGCDEIWHAGDIGDYTIIQKLRDVAPVIRAVSGNIDHGTVTRHCPAMLIFETEGLRVLLTHVGGYPGKYFKGIPKLLADNHIGLMVCGHSHILKVIPDHRLELLHINPGAAGWYGWQKVRTLIRITIDNGRVTSLDVIELAKGNGTEK